MKIGTENRKQLILLSVLGLAAIGFVVNALLPSAPPAMPAAPPNNTASNTTRANFRRTSSGKLIKAVEPRLDPTLDMALLAQSEDAKYAGNGRNIFVERSEPIPTPVKSGVAEATRPQLPVIQPPPPINLKFFGFASKPGEAKRIFLSQGEDVFIAGEGDIVNRRYRVLHISPAAVDIEDVLNNNRQSIPLTQG